MKHRSVQLHAEIVHLNKLNKVFKSYLKPYLLKRLEIYLLHLIKYETDNKWGNEEKAQEVRSRAGLANLYKFVPFAVETLALSEKEQWT
jgi:hypothetical protein